MPAHRCAALAAMFAAPLALGEITGVFSTTSLSAFARLERNGNEEAGDDFLDFVFLDQLGSFDETRLSTAKLPTADASAEVFSSATFSASEDEVSLFFEMSASASFDVRANDTFAFARTRTANITGFTTDEAVRVTLSGDAALAFDLNFLFIPELPQTVLAVVPGQIGGDPIIDMGDFEGAFFHEVILPPGSYQLRAAVDDTIQSFAFPEGLYTADSELTLTATIATVPAPGGLAVFAGAALARPRRR